MLKKIESFIYACLPALLILIFSEVAVFLSDGKAVTMGLLGLFYLILIWWLYQYSRGKVVVADCPMDDVEPIEVPAEAED